MRLPWVRGPAEGQLVDFRETARQWLRLAVHLLKGRKFPDVAKEKQGKYCPFTKLCGDNIYKASQAYLEALPPDDPARQFLALGQASGDAPKDTAAGASKGRKKAARATPAPKEPKIRKASRAKRHDSI